MNELTATDIHELTSLYSEYSWAFDSGRGADCAALFTDDGIFRNGENPPIEGRPDLEAFFVRAAGNGTRHQVSNIRLSGTEGEHAHGAAYVLVLRTEEDKLRLVTMGEYHDTFARIDGAWKIEERRVAPTLSERLAGAVLAESC